MADIEPIPSNEKSPMLRPLQPTEFEVKLRGHDIELDHYYQENLQKTQDTNALIISLDDIPEVIKDIRIEQLKLKLQEYTERLKQYQNVKIFQIDNSCKRDVLRLVLEKGSMNTLALSRAYAEMGSDDSAELEVIYAIINSYVKSGGLDQKQTGGTGLASVEKFITLESLQPTESSLPWLRQKGMTEQAEDLERKTEEAINKLRNYKDNPFTEEDALRYSQLAAKSGSGLLQFWVGFNMYYPYPWVEPENDDSRKAWSKANKEFDRNRAVLFRDEATKEKKPDEAKRKLRVAQNYFNRHVDNISRAGVQISIDVEKIKESFQEFDDNTEIAGLFFDPKISETVEEYRNATYSMGDGKLQIPGIDAGLIRVASAILPLPNSMEDKEAPEVIEARKKLLQYFADKNKVSMEDIKRLEDYEARAMFPD